MIDALGIPVYNSFRVHVINVTPAYFNTVYQGCPTGGPRAGCGHQPTFMWPYIYELV